jgi:hypothetical protein
VSLGEKEMIVFSGPTVPSRTALQWSRLGNPLQESLWNVDQPQRSVKPFDLAKQKQVNLSDLANVTIDILCRLQILYNNNNTGDEWVNLVFYFDAFEFSLFILLLIAFIRFGSCLTSTLAISLTPSNWMDM